MTKSPTPPHYSCGDRPGYEVLFGPLPTQPSEEEVQAVLRGVGCLDATKVRPVVDSLTGKFKGCVP